MKDFERGYFKAPNDIFELGLTPFQIAVYLYLARCGNNSNDAYPSFATIAEKCGMGERKAKEVVKELVSMGLLIKQHRWGEKGRQSNLYSVVRPDLSGVQSDTSNPYQSSPHAFTPVHDMHKDGAPHAQYKELDYKELDYKEKTYIDFEKIDDEFIDIYNHHLKQNNMTHKRVTEEQSEFIKDQLDRIREQHDVNELLFEEVVIYRFANFPKNNDGDIRPFLQAFSRLLEEWEIS